APLEEGDTAPPVLAALHPAIDVAATRFRDPPAAPALLAADLGVIVDMHPSAMNPVYQPAELTAGVNTPKFQAVLAL
ncbi:hypothetical protein ABTC36_20090, partial [Acinetobacter baumannii]